MPIGIVHFKSPVNLGTISVEEVDLEKSKKQVASVTEKGPFLVFRVVEGKPRRVRVPMSNVADIIEYEADDEKPEAKKGNEPGAALVGATVGGAP